VIHQITPPIIGNHAIGLITFKSIKIQSFPSFPIYTDSGDVKQETASFKYLNASTLSMDQVAMAKKYHCEMFWRLTHEASFQVAPPWSEKSPKQYIAVPLLSTKCASLTFKSPHFQSFLKGLG